VDGQTAAHLEIEGGHEFPGLGGPDRQGPGGVPGDEQTRIYMIDPGAAPEISLNLCLKGPRRRPR
jgi:hypothetical protein